MELPLPTLCGFLQHSAEFSQLRPSTIRFAILTTLYQLHDRVFCIVRPIVEYLPQHEPMPSINYRIRESMYLTNDHPERSVNVGQPRTRII